ncbi:hypothetical protein WA556_002338, partial [Blastocystis sp. ATCC 50177/Nand II]
MDGANIARSSMKVQESGSKESSPLHSNGAAVFQHNGTVSCIPSPFSMGVSSLASSPLGLNLVGDVGANIPCMQRSPLPVAISVVPATGSVENGSNGLSLNGLCRVVLSPIVNDNQQSVPTLIVNGRQQSVPTLIGNGRQQSVPTPIGNDNQQSVPTPIVNGSQQPVPTPIVNGRQQSVPTPIGNGKQQPMQPKPMSMTSIPAVFINANNGNQASNRIHANNIKKPAEKPKRQTRRRKGASSFDGKNTVSPARAARYASIAQQIAASDDVILSKEFFLFLLSNAKGERVFPYLESHQYWFRSGYLNTVCRTRCHDVLPSVSVPVQIQAVPEQVIMIDALTKEARGQAELRRREALHSRWVLPSSTFWNNSSFRFNKWSESELAMLKAGVRENASMASLARRLRRSAVEVMEKVKELRRSKKWTKRETVRLLHVSRLHSCWFVVAVHFSKRSIKEVKRKAHQLHCKG